VVSSIHKQKQLLSQILHTKPDISWRWYSDPTWRPITIQAI